MIFFLFSLNVTLKIYHVTVSQITSKPIPWVLSNCRCWFALTNTFLILEKPVSIGYELFSFALTLDPMGVKYQTPALLQLHLKIFRLFYFKQIVKFLN